MDGNKIKSFLEKELVGKLPLFFQDISVLHKEGDEESPLYVTRSITVDAFQTSNYILGRSYKKRISKTIDFGKE